MSILVVKGILPLLLLAWPPAGECRCCALILPGRGEVEHCCCRGGLWAGSWVHLFSALLGVLQHLPLQDCLRGSCCGFELFYLCSNDAPAGGLGQSCFSAHPVLLQKLLTPLRHQCLHHILCPATGTPDGWGRSKPAAWGWHPQGLTRRMWVFHSTNPTSLLLFSAGLADQCSQTTSVSLGSDLTFHCLPNSPDREVVWCDTLSKKKKAEKDTGSALHKENVSSNFTFTSVNEKHAGNYMCEMKTSCPVAEKKNRPCKNHKAKDTCGKSEPGMGSRLCAVGWDVTAAQRLGSSSCWRRAQLLHACFASSTCWWDVSAARYSHSLFYFLQGTCCAGSCSGQRIRPCT